MKVLDLFAGIGGFSLGLERAGFETVAFCEIEPYCQKVLAKHWPGVPIYDDIRELTAKRLVSDGIRPDVITGGFPCQDISAAGNQAGITENTRSGLWSECARLLGEIRPRYAIFENVTALLNGSGGNWFKRVLWDISQVGYDAEWHCIPASELGAHHHRDRVWIVCYPSQQFSDVSQSVPNAGGTVSGLRESGRADISADVADTNRSRQEGYRGMGHKELEKPCRPQVFTGRISQDRDKHWETESGVGRVANGVPRTMDRLKCLGNAVVPQIPELIGRAILNER